MTGSYHLWHPAFVVAEPLTLEAFVTEGDALLPPLTDDRLARAVLAAIGLEPTWREWSVDPVRTCYFTSYGDSLQWTDRWPLAWRVRAELDPHRAGRTAPQIPSDGPADLEVGSRPPDADDACRCELLVDAPDGDTVDELRDRLAGVVPDADAVPAKAFGRFPQLRYDLGPRSQQWYAAGQADALAAAVSAAGGVPTLR